MASTEAVALSRVVGERLFVVPDYQRPYAWERRQLADLWQDLDLMGDGNNHYTGTLVLLPGGVSHTTSTGEVLMECGVVDGQQRLITCFLLIDRIRRALDGLVQRGVGDAAERASGLRSVFGSVKVDGVGRPRLQLAEEQNDYWTDVVLAGGQHTGSRLTEGERRLRDAVTFFDDGIASLGVGLSAAQSFHQVVRLQSRVTNGLRFLVYEVDSTADAGVIFETLNGRGRDLTELDRIKNYLLFLAHTLPPAMAEHLTAKVNSAWSDIHDHLAGTGIGEDQLLRAHWLATQDPDAKTWKGAVSVKDLFSREKFVPNSSRLTAVAGSGVDVATLQDELMTSVTDYVTTLSLCALFDRELIVVGASFSSFGGDAQAAQAGTAALRRAGLSSSFRPLLFAARLTHPDDGRFYADLTDQCERFAARVFTLTKWRSHTGQSSLRGAAHRLYTGEANAAGTLTFLRDLTWGYADDDRVRRAFDVGEKWYLRPGLRYFLYAYELWKARDTGDVPDFSTFTATTRAQKTIEHVLPQHPDWESADWSCFTGEEHALLVDGIGNLVLTYDNSSYGRKPFAAKKGAQGQLTPPCYADSALAQERDLVAYEDWTPESIRERADDLAHWAIRRWRIEPSGTEQGPEDLDDDDVPVGDEDYIPLAGVDLSGGPHDQQGFGS